MTVHSTGPTSAKFYSKHWCSQAERLRFPSRRCVSEAALAPLRAASLRSAPQHLQGASRKNWKSFHSVLKLRCFFLYITLSFKKTDIELFIQFMLLFIMVPVLRLLPFCFRFFLKSYIACNFYFSMVLARWFLSFIAALWVEKSIKPGSFTGNLQRKRWILNMLLKPYIHPKFSER